MRLATVLLPALVSPVLVAGCAPPGSAEERPFHSPGATIPGGKSDGPLDRKAWTFMLYGAADNDLDLAITRDVNELESVGSTDEVNFVAFLDLPSGARTYYLERDEDEHGITSPSRDLGPVNSGRIDTLIEFVTWAIESYPADRYVLVIGGHGGGVPRTIAVDYDTGSSIDVRELPHAIDEIVATSGSSLYLFGADACLIGTVESLFELNAHFVVASEETEPGEGWDYAPIARELTLLASRPLDEDSFYTLPSHMVDTFASSYPAEHDVTLVAAMPDAYPSLAIGALAELVERLLDDGSYVEDIAWARDNALRFDAFVDVGHFAHLLSTRVTDPQLQDLIENQLLDDLPGIALAAHVPEHVRPWSVGVSIYFPTRLTASELEVYRNSEFAREQRWDEVLARFYGLW